MKRAPRTLGTEGRRLWKTLQASFEFSEEDYLLLQTLAENFDLMASARAELLEKGLSIPAQQGGFKSNPASQVLTSARDGFLKTWKMLKIDGEEPGRGPGRPPDQFLGGKRR